MSRRASGSPVDIWWGKMDFQEAAELAKTKKKKGSEEGMGMKPFCVNMTYRPFLPAATQSISHFLMPPLMLRFVLAPLQRRPLSPGDW
jgi:hypothetical protein